MPNGGKLSIVGLSLPGVPDAAKPQEDWSQYEDKSKSEWSQYETTPNDNTAKESILGKIWKGATSPLVDIRSSNPEVKTATDEFARAHPYIGKPLNYIADSISGLSSPLNLATTGAFTGAGLTTGALSKGLNTVGRALSAPVAAEGASQMIQGHPLTGGLELAGGIMGMRGIPSSEEPKPSTIIPPKLGQKADKVVDTATKLPWGPEDDEELSPSDKLVQAINAAKPLNEDQAKIYTTERAAKFANAKDIDVNSPESARQFLGALSGEHTKVSMTPPELSAEDVNGLYSQINDKIKDVPKKANAITGLNKILAGQVPQESELNILSDVFGSNFGDATKRVFGVGGLNANDFLTKLANFSSKTARMVLGLHVPGTAISFHGFNEAIRNTLYGEDLNPVNTAKRAVDSINYLARPSKANNYLKLNEDELGKAINDGDLRVQTGDIPYSGLFKGDNIVTKGINFLTDPKPLFGQVIPALKLKSYQRLLTDYTSKGMPYDQAAKAAGYATNNIFGGLNLQALERDPQTQKLFRIAALAPDWMESNFRLGKGTFDAIKNPNLPQNKVYQVGMANFLGSYIAGQVINAINNEGKFSWQNEPGHELDFVYGKDSMGKVRYFAPYGTAMDFIRIPMMIAHAAAKNNPDLGEAFKVVGDRMSEPMQMIKDLTSNTDYAGRPLYGKDKYGRPIPPLTQASNILGDIVSHTIPIGAESGIDLARGRISPEQFAAQALQLPMRYKFPEGSAIRKVNFK